jgi:hypothetical protein
MLALLAYQSNILQGQRRHHRRRGRDGRRVLMLVGQHQEQGVRWGTQLKLTEGKTVLRIDSPTKGVNRVCSVAPTQRWGDWTNLPSSYAAPTERQEDGHVFIRPGHPILVLWRKERFTSLWVLDAALG